MLLEPDVNVMGFMNKKHPLMKSPTWKKNLKEVMTSRPYEPLKLKSSFYFRFDMKVSRNIYRDDISNGVFTKKEMLYNCTKHDRQGLRMELSNGHHQLVTFHDFMTNHDSFMIFSHDLDSQIPQIKNVLSNVTYTKRIRPTACRLLDENFGDPQQYLCVLHGHNAKLKPDLRAAEDNAMKDADLSTSRVIKVFTLNNNDSAFVRVKSEVDKVMATSVEGVYGEFTELPTPILTQVR